jgi:hypothetical protein
MGMIGVTLNPTKPPKINTMAIPALTFRAIHIIIIITTEIVGIALMVSL